MLSSLTPATLKSAREAAALSRAQLAALAEVSETTILRIENGAVDPRFSQTWAPIVRALEATNAKPRPTRTDGVAA